jgi:Fe2+ or Zn2+ uptake regulation protein
VVNPLVLAAALRAARLSRTQTRMLVLAELARTGSSPRTARDIHAALRRGRPSLPFSTTYRVLQCCTGPGLVVAVATDPCGPAYHLNADLIQKMCRPDP